VVSGDATVTVGDRTEVLTRGQAIDIARGERHRLENFGGTDVVVIEVEFGQYLGEDDIVRYDDVYGRV
jgi:mannose-6-phosphate isomerase-like protein (cupin superfamily)